MYYCIHKFLQNWINRSLWYVHIKYTSTSSNISTSNTFIFVQLFPLQRFTISVCLSNGMCVLAWRRQRRCFTGIWYTRIEWVSLSLWVWMAMLGHASRAQIFSSETRLLARFYHFIICCNSQWENPHFLPHDIFDNDR